MEAAPTAKKKRGSFAWLIGIAIKSTKLFKSIKLLKVLITPLSMLLSVLVYGWSLGFWFAFGFVMLMFIHEMGHVMAMKIKGYPTKMPIFIPLLGAVIFAPDFKNREDEAFIGYGGPFIGGLGALALFGISAILPQHSDLLITLSYSGVFLNLFNLIPISPMDGGRVTKIIGNWFVWIGVAMLIALIILIKSPFIFLIGILALSDINMGSERRFRLALGLELAMLAMITLGVSSQGIAGDIADVALASLFTGMYYLNHRKYIKERAQFIEDLKNLEEERAAINLPPLSASERKKLIPDWEGAPAVAEKPAPAGTRMKWLALYLGLAAFLVAALATQTHYLPAHLHQ